MKSSVSFALSHCCITIFNTDVEEETPCSIQIRRLMTEECSVVTLASPCTMYVNFIDTYKYWQALNKQG